MRRRGVLVVLALILVLLTTGCQVKVAVGVEAEADGSGRVRVTATMDKEAAADAGSLALGDMKATGWVVEGPRSTPGGGAVIVATRPFRSPAEATAVLESLSGSSGPLRGFTIVTDRSLLRTRTRFAGTVDLTAGLNGFGDADLGTRLGGPGIGLDPAAVKQATGVDLDKALGLTVDVVLPGSLTGTNAPTTAGHRATWQPAVGQQVELAAAASEWNTRAIGFLVVAALCGLSALVLVLRGFRRAQPRSHA